MKPIVSLIAFLIVLNPLNAQLDEDLLKKVKWGEFFRLGKRAIAPTIIGQDGESIFIIRTIKKKKSIEKYNLNTLKLVKSNLIDLSYNKKSLNLVGQFMFGESPVLYTNFYNKKTKKSFFFIQSINHETLALSEPIIVAKREIGAKKNASPFSALYGRWNAMAGAYMICSEDGELGYFFTQKAESDGGDSPGIKPDKYEGILYDSDFNILSEGGFELPYENFKIMQKTLSKDGLMYILGYEHELEESQKLLRKKQTINAGDMHILIFDIETGEIENLEVSLENQEISMVVLKILKNGGVQLSGLTKDSGKGVSGAFSILFNANYEEINNTTHEFEDDFITDTWTAKSKKKLDKKNKKEDKKGKKKTAPAFFNYYLNHVVEKPDGSTCVLAEQYYVRVVTRTTTTGNGGTTTTTTYYYYYNDIIAINFDKNGDFQWKTLIEKRQKSVNDGGYYLSYFVLQEDNNIHLIYNDYHYVDENTTSNSKKAGGGRYMGVQVTLDSEGNASKEKFFEFEEENKLRLVPKRCAKAGDGIGFLYAKGRKGEKLGRVTFN